MIRPIVLFGVGLIALGSTVTCNHRFVTQTYEDDPGGTGGAGDGGLAECAEDEDCPSTGACIDARCISGACILELRHCNDGNPCTLNTCDPSLNECTTVTANEGLPCASNAVCAFGSCECLDGFENCNGDLGCEASLASDPLHCGTCNLSCPSGEACVDSTCTRCDDDNQCDDGRSCTTGTCEDGECRYTLSSGCLIAGQCYAANEQNPVNECEVCLPTNPSQWSPRSGSCNPEYECGQGTCQDGSCRTEPAPGKCWIEGKCYDDGAPNPADPDCEFCNAADPRRWSCKPGGLFSRCCASISPLTH